MTSTAKLKAEVSLEDHEPFVDLPNRRPYANAPIKFKKQISDTLTILSDKWTGQPDRTGLTLPDTEAARPDARVVIELYAPYADGPEQIDRFFTKHTAFDDATRQRLKLETLAGPREGLSQKQVGLRLGLDWSTRKRLHLTNVDAVDTPSAEVQEEARRAYDRAYGREYRAAKRQLPKPISPAKKRSAEQMSRRLAAISAAVGTDDGLPVTDLCEKLAKIKDGPFSGMDATSIPRTVHRAIAASDGSLQSELRPFKGRPDLKPQMWVWRLPARQFSYRNQFVARLAEFTPETARAIAAWFYSDAERDLRQAAGFDRDADEFMKLARARRDQLTGKPPVS